MNEELMKKFLEELENILKKSSEKTIDIYEKVYLIIKCIEKYANSDMYHILNSVFCYLNDELTYEDLFAFSDVDDLDFISFDSFASYMWNKYLKVPKEVNKGLDL